MIRKWRRVFCGRKYSSRGEVPVHPDAVLGFWGDGSFAKLFWHGGEFRRAGGESLVTQPEFWCEAPWSREEGS
jgi:hypothetical protein